MESYSESSEKIKIKKEFLNIQGNLIEPTWFERLFCCCSCDDFELSPSETSTFVSLKKKYSKDFSEDHEQDLNRLFHLAFDTSTNPPQKTEEWKQLGFQVKL